MFVGLLDWTPLPIPVEICRAMRAEGAQTEGVKYLYPSESYAQTGVCGTPYHRVKQTLDCSAGPTGIF